LFFNQSMFSVFKKKEVKTVYEQQADVIIQNLSVGVVVYNADFEVQIFNAAAEDIFGVTMEEAQAQKLDASLAMDPKLQVLTQVIFPTLAPVVIKHSDPGVYPQVADVIFDSPHLELQVITDVVRDETGKPSGFVKLITNKTREANLIKSKAEFITVAAHQLRTPLTAVNWALEALEGSITDPSQKELLDTGFSAVKNSLKIVNDLLDVSKMEEGRFGYEFRPVRIVDFLEKALQQAQDLAKQYGVKFYFDHTPQADVSVSADEQKLGIAFFNLFDNAIQYNVENGEVTVRVRRDMVKNTVEVSVRDTGIGIPAEQLDKIFTKFFRADNAQKTVANGNGLGLYIARNIVQAHGGDMRLESELNRGTTFYVTLPVSA
jgi:signal transduction histidine kinase